VCHVLPRFASDTVCSFVLGLFHLAMFPPRITLRGPPSPFPLLLPPLGADFTAVALPEMSGLEKSRLTIWAGANPKAVSRERMQFVLKKII
jgi:hypothetical protein